MALLQRHPLHFHPQLNSKRLRMLLGLLFAAVVIVSVWVFTPLAEYLDHKRLQGFLWHLRSENNLALIAIPLLYSVGSLFFFPINMLILATAHLFPMEWAFTYVGLGIFADLCTSYFLGRMLGPPLFKHFFGRRNQKIIKALGEGQLSTLILLRIVPVAPNNLINLTAGASRIPFPRFALATFIGMAPGTVLLIVFQKSIVDVIRNPSWWSVALLLGFILLVLASFRWIRQRLSELTLGKRARTAAEG